LNFDFPSVPFFQETQISIVLYYRAMFFAFKLTNLLLYGLWMDNKRLFMDDRSFPG
jgi:hypothetical protein